MFLEKLTPTVMVYVAMGVMGILVYIFRKRIRKGSYNPLKGWQLFLLFASPVLLVLVFSIVRYVVVYAPRFTQFNAHMSEYISVTTRQPGEWYLRGKVLPIDTRSNKIHVETYYDLTDSLRPQTPEEVKMALWMDCGKSLTGTYSHGGGAYQWHCKVTLVDLMDRVILGEKTFAGSEPPLTNPGSSDQTGSFPLEMIIATLQALPVK